MANVQRPELLPAQPQVASSLLDRLAEDYRTFGEGGPPDALDDYIKHRYGLLLETQYAGFRLKNPWGKASGQLSMTSRQVAEDVEAGLGFIVLKTVIAEDEAGAKSMKAWAIKESRMAAERINGGSGETGWTISWKGRGWWQSLDEYLQLIGDAQRIARGTDTLIVPSCKYHLPRPDEQAWKTSEYAFTTQRLIRAWQEAADSPRVPMPLEKDFSPTLAGSDRATAQERVLDWLREVPDLVRRSAMEDERVRSLESGAERHAPISTRRAADSVPHSGSAGTESAPSVRIGLKIFNALFEDDFQLELLRAIHEGGRPDFFVYANRLFDPDREFDGYKGIAYGGPDLSDRNLRVMARFQKAADCGEIVRPLIPWSATGNVCSGKLALEYALRGASSFQIHTFFQLPAEQYAMKAGSKIEKALHELYFHPRDGFIAWMHHLASCLKLPTEPLCFEDVIGRGRELTSATS